MDKKIIIGKLSLFRGTIISDTTVIEKSSRLETKDIFFPKTNQQASDFLYYIIETSHFSFDKRFHYTSKFHISKS